MCQPNRTQVNESTSTSDKKPKKTYGYDSTVYSAAPTAHLDNFLCELLPSVDVELMSGEKDPNGSTVPQQPLHHALLPNAAKYSGFYRRTNPCWLEVAGTSFLGTSGQNIDDIFKYLDSHDRISMSCSTLEWSHMAPTAPDTLCEYKNISRQNRSCTHALYSQSVIPSTIGILLSLRKRPTCTSSVTSHNTRVDSWLAKPTRMSGRESC